MSTSIRVDYEIPPLRAIYAAWYVDDGQTDEQVTEWLAQEKPSWRVRKISRLKVHEVGPRK